MTSFLAAAGSIVVIDLLLAGDNAVVIAMAVRGLPLERRRVGIALGALAAVVIRVILTFFVAQLLQMSYVRLVGGALILWIALKLFVQGEEDERGHHATSVGDAIKVIVVADVTMSLDNMLAVGGASHGNLPLLVFGLALSIPFIVFTSDLLSRLMNRYPVIVYAGAAILGKVAAEMMLTDPATEALVHPSRTLLHAMEALFAAVIVAGGLLWARRDQDRDGEDTIGDTRAIAQPGMEARVTSSGGRPGRIRYDGATTIGLHLLPDLLPLFERAGHGVSHVGERGTNRGLDAVRAGEVDVAGVMREISPSERAESLRWALVGYDALAVFVHAANPVRSLTRAQLKGIFTGALRRWSAVGGPETDIVPVTELRSGGRGTVVEFRRLALDEADYGPARELEDAPDCLREVAANPGGITVASMSMAMEGVRAIAIDGVEPSAAQVRAGAYALGRPMYLVARAPASPEAAALLDLALSAAGQAIVGKKFTPAR